MKIGLIDVDGHNFPNLALMKLSQWHKAYGDEVEWWNIAAPHYDRVYMAKVFSDAYTQDAPTPWNASEIIRGGSGYAIRLENGKEVYHKEYDPELPAEIEHIYPDYSLYPQFTGYGDKLKKQTAYGFLTRGCPRGCDFCHVAPKEGRCSRKVANLDEFWHGQGNICLSDPNILACKDSPNLLWQLAESGAKVEFNQGLDARLLTREKAEQLARMRLHHPHFAMDRMQDVEAVAKGLKLFADAYREVHGKWSWRNAKVFVLTNFETSHEQDMERVQILREIDYQPYIMIYNKPSAPAITKRLARWCNSSVGWAVTDSFEQFQKREYKEVLNE